MAKEERYTKRYTFIKDAPFEIKDGRDKSLGQADKYGSKIYVRFKKGDDRNKFYLVVHNQGQWARRCCWS